MIDPFEPQSATINELVNIDVDNGEIICDETEIEIEEPIQKVKKKKRK